jgi:hypothetical protein
MRLTDESLLSSSPSMMVKKVQKKMKTKSFKAKRKDNDLKRIKRTDKTYHSIDPILKLKDFGRNFKNNIKSFSKFERSKGFKAQFGELDIISTNKPLNFQKIFSKINHVHSNQY